MEELVAQISCERALSKLYQGFEYDQTCFASARLCKIHSKALTQAR
jgi:hypothetical protein